MVVWDAGKFIEHDLASILDGVGAVRSPGSLRAVTPRASLYTLGRLGGHHVQARLVAGNVVVGQAHLRALPWQRVPHRWPARIRALLASPRCLALSVVGRQVRINELATNNEAILVVGLTTLVVGASPAVVGEEWPEHGVMHVPELLCGQHGDLEALNPVNVVLSRRGWHHFPVQVPQDPSEVGHVHILRRVASPALSTVDVERQRLPVSRLASRSRGSGGARHRSHCGRLR
mmetsp:Transcript_66668/g.171638  ORF Transcript_66668/g.171638 Transcript_66668/m.171638 type:complete len:232 (-) Transcript_66668:651-1346(-)